MKQRVFVHLVISVALLTLLALTVTRTAAQETVDVTVFRDEETLTLFVDGNLPVSLEGLEFSVETSTGEIEVYALDSFVAFRGLDFTELDPPICFRLEYSQTDSPPPSVCLPAPDYRPLLVRQRLSLPDIFWYDRNAVSDLIVTINGAGEERECAAEECPLEYISDVDEPTSEMRERATPTAPLSSNPPPEPTHTPTNAGTRGYPCPATISSSSSRIYTHQLPSSPENLNDYKRPGETVTLYAVERNGSGQATWYRLNPISEILQVWLEARFIVPSAQCPDS
jgi:hypothetical protein